MKQRKTGLEILSGWKDIARHLGKGVRTVQRYERDLELPVRRPAGKSHGSVIATRVEIDAWVLASPIRKAFQLPQTSIDNATHLSEFRRHVQETHRLREETKELRAALRASLTLLRKNLRLALPKQDETRESSVGRPRGAEVLPFDPNMKVM